MLSLTSIHSLLQRAFQNREANWVPLSEMMIWGRPWCFQTCCRKRVASSSEVQLDRQGTKGRCNRTGGAAGTQVLGESDGRPNGGEREPDGDAGGGESG